MLTFASLPAGFGAALVINGDGDGDTVLFNTDLNLGANGLSVTAETIQQGAGTSLVVGGLTTLNAGTSGTIVLSETGNDFATVSVTNTNDVTLRDASAIDLGTSNIAGLLIVTAGGEITDSGNLTVGGTTFLDASAANSITLDESGNNFAILAIIAANNATLVDSNAIVLGSGVVASNFSVTANGGITEATPATSVLDVGGNLSLMANGDIGSPGTGALDVQVGGTASLTALGSDIFMTSDVDLVISQLTTAADQTDTIDIRTTNNTTLTLTGTGGYTGLDNGGAGDDGDNLILNADGALTIQTTAISARSFDLDTTGDQVNLDVSMTANQFVEIDTAGGALADLGTPTFSVGSVLDVDLGAGDGEIDGVIAGAGGLIKSGAGTLTLNGVNTYSGTTMINAGELTVTGEIGAATGAGTVSIANGATLNTQRDNQRPDQRSSRVGHQCHRRYDARSDDQSHGLQHGGRVKRRREHRHAAGFQPGGVGQQHALGDHGGSGWHVDCSQWPQPERGGQPCWPRHGRGRCGCQHGDGLSGIQPSDDHRGWRSEPGGRDLRRGTRRASARLRARSDHRHRRHNPSPGRRLRGR